MIIDKIINEYSKIRNGRLNHRHRSDRHQSYPKSDCFRCYDTIRHFGTIHHHRWNHRRRHFGQLWSPGWHQMHLL